MKARLASDIPERCQAEHAQAYKVFAGNHKQIQLAISKVKESILNCYQGNHSLCKKYSFVCKRLETNNWILRSTYLPDEFKMHCTKQDLENMQQCIDYRLNEKMLDRTKLPLNTQKAESFNQAIISKAPKSKTFTRNRSSKVHCACKAVNRGTGRTIIEQTKACGVPIIKGTRVSAGLKRRHELDTRRKLPKRSLVDKERHRAS